jgi:hydrogenase expression/formation protein HypC
VVEILPATDVRMGRVDFGGVARKVCLEHVPEAAPGDWVLVHVGFALSRIDEAEAQRVFALLRELGQADEMAEEPPS